MLVGGKPAEHAVVEGRYALTEHDEALKPLLAQCPPEVKAGFFKRVYSLLTLQLLATAAICSLPAWHPPTHEFVLTHPGLLWVAAGLGLVALCLLFYLKDRHPFNLLLLGGFTLSQSYAVMFVITAYCDAGGTYVVLGALGATVGIFACLSVYVHTTKRDFRFLDGMLFVAMIALIGIGLVAVFVASRLLDSLVATAGVLIFSGYVLYDTSEMVHRMGPDDVVLAVVDLYLDIINLFLYLLTLFGQRD